MKRYDLILIDLAIGSVIGILVFRHIIINFMPTQLSLLQIISTFFIPLSLVSLGGVIIGIWIKIWKEAKEKAKREKPFSKIESLQELSLEQKNLLINMVKLQRKICLAAIFVAPSPIVFWLLLEFKLHALLYVIFGIAALIAISFYFRVTVPLKSLQFELRAKGMPAFPKYLPAYKAGIKFLLLGWIPLIILLIWIIFFHDSLIWFILPIVVLFFLYEGIVCYVVSKKNEEKLS